jgi:hypothetical protein
LPFAGTTCVAPAACAALAAEWNNAAPIPHTKNNTIAFLQRISPPLLP